MIYNLIVIWTAFAILAMFMFKIRTAGLIGLPVTRFYTVLVCLVNIVKKFEINLC